MSLFDRFEVKKGKNRIFFHFRGIFPLSPLVLAIFIQGSNSKSETCSCKSEKGSCHPCERQLTSEAGKPVAFWQVWVRSDLNNDWTNTAAYTPANFPNNDIGLMPPGAQWWQIKVCGSDNSNNTLTPFSNVVSLGPVPN